MATAEEILMAAEDPKYDELVLIDLGLDLDSDGYPACRKIFVENKKLSMSEASYADGFIEYIDMIDKGNNDYYRLNSDGGRLQMTKLTSAPDEAVMSLTFVDSYSTNECELYIRNGKLMLDTVVIVDNLPDDKDVLILDFDNRKIVIPSTITNLGVESDDDVTRLNFHMPRYFCGIDLAEFEIRINYENAKREGDVYEVKDAVVDTDVIAFSWLVGRPAVAYEGDARFIVCLKKIGEDGETVEKEFNTTPASLPVLEGLETAEAVFQDHADIILEFRREQKEMIEAAVTEWISSNEVLSDERVNAAVTLYFTENPVKISDEQVGALVDDYFTRNPVTGVTEEMVESAIGGYFEKNPIEIPEVNLDDYFNKEETRLEISDQLSELDPVEKHTFDLTIGSIKPRVVQLENFYPEYLDGKHTVKTWDGDYVTPNITGTVTHSGSCGDNVTWKLTSTGCLVISGSGAMEDFTSFTGMGWCDYRDNVTSIIIENGITHIGARAFYRCINTGIAVVIPSTVKSIGDSAFYRCDSLTDFIFEGQVQSVGTNNFNKDALKLKFIDAPISEIHEDATNCSIYFCASWFDYEGIYEAYNDNKIVVLRNIADNTNYLLSSSTETESVFTRVRSDGAVVSITYSVNNDEFTASTKVLATESYVLTHLPVTTNVSLYDDGTAYTVADTTGEYEISIEDIRIRTYGNVAYVGMTIFNITPDMTSKMLWFRPPTTLPALNSGNVMGPLHVEGLDYIGNVYIGGGGIGLYLDKNIDSTSTRVRTSIVYISD